MTLTKDQTEQLLDFKVFRAASTTSARQLLEKANAMTVEQGAHILEEGDPSESVYAILDGLVGVFYSAPSGSNVLVKVFGPPALFGEMELPFAQPRLEYVEVLERAVIAQIPGDAFLELVRGDAGACYALFEDMAARLCVSAYLERALAFQDVETRTAGLFLSLLDARPASAASPSLPIRLTYPLIARCLGATEKSVERTIRKWTKEGWLQRKDGWYTIDDPAALRAKADPDLMSIHVRLETGPRRA